MTTWTSGRVGSRIATSRSGPLLELDLNHPPVNALDSTSYAEILGCFRAIVQDPSVTVCLIRGAQAHFSAGQDTNDASTITRAPADYLSHAADAIVEVTTSPAYIVCAVRRFAVGAGLILASCADVLILDESARLFLPEKRYGLSAGAAHVSRWLGTSDARSAVESGDAIPPASFQGAVVTPDIHVEEEARAAADRLVLTSESGLRGTDPVRSQGRLEVATAYREEIQTSLATGTIDFTGSTK